MIYTTDLFKSQTSKPVDWWHCNSTHLSRCYIDVFCEQRGGKHMKKSTQILDTKVDPSFLWLKIIVYLNSFHDVFTENTVNFNTFIWMTQKYFCIYFNLSPLIIYILNIGWSSWICHGKHGNMFLYILFQFTLQTQLLHQRLDWWGYFWLHLRCMCPANQRWHYIVTPSLIGSAHTQKDPCSCEDDRQESYIYKIRNPCIRKIFTRLRIDMKVLSTCRINKTIAPACPLCSRELESVLHFVLKCPVYDRQRNLFIDKIVSRSPSFQKFRWCSEAKIYCRPRLSARGQ